MGVHWENKRTVKSKYQAFGMDDFMKKFILSIFFILCSSVAIATPQDIELANHRIVSVVDNIDSNAHWTITKLDNSEIIADVNFCGRSALADSDELKSIKMNRRLYKRIIKSSTAYSLTQGSTKLYVSSIWGNNISCAPQKQVKLKIKIIEMYDKKNKNRSNLILLR